MIKYLHKKKYNLSHESRNCNFTNGIINIIETVNSGRHSKRLFESGALSFNESKYRNSQPLSLSTYASHARLDAENPTQNRR